MGWFFRKDTARRAYIRLLRERVDSLDKLTPELRRTVMYADLIAAGHLDGVTSNDEYDFPKGNVIKGITVQGRLFLEELEKQERNDSVFGRISKFIIILGTFLAGIGSAIAIAFAKGFLKVQ